MSSKDPSEVVIQGAGRLVGEYHVPGDKSVSHRSALFGALARGTTSIRNFVQNRDCLATLDCIERLGVRVQREGSDVRITSDGRESITGRELELDCQNSGTTFRLLMGLLAGCDGEFVLIGDESLNRRPMERVARPLRRMGATISTCEGKPPVRVCGRRSLDPMTLRVDPPSAQVKSAVLLAGLVADGVTTVEEAVQTRNHTEVMLPAFGVEVDSEPGRVRIRGPQSLRESRITVPGDISSAAFLVGAALLVDGSSISIRGVGTNPTRTGFLSVLERIGARVSWATTPSPPGEPVGDILVEHSGLLKPRWSGANVLNADDVARVIDEIPILAVLATIVDGGLTFRGAGDLRKKESDRIRCMVDGLRKMGADVEEWEDGFSVAGPADLVGARINPDHDHRIAMAFGCAGLRAEGSTTIEDPGVADVSFPGFFDLVHPNSAKGLAL